MFTRISEVGKETLTKKISSKSCQTWIMVNYRLELQTLDGNCALGQSFLCASFLFMSVFHFITLKRAKIHIVKPCAWEKGLD